MITTALNWTRPTAALARFAAGLNLAGIPGPVQQQVKLACLDAIGCGLYGADLPWSRAVIHTVLAEGGRREASIWTRPRRVSALHAALALGTMIHSFDFDDYHNAKVHPAAAVLPAALTTAEAAGASGADLLAGLVAGYEAMIRTSLAIGPNASRLRGWHLTGTTGTIGAAAAAGRITGLTPEQMVSALGLGGTQSAGLWAFNADGAMSKRLHPGKAAHSGLLAAMLARRGFTGPSQILEAQDGSLPLATSDGVNLAEITWDLGERWEAGRVSIKPYSCCGSTHSAVDGALDLMAEHQLRPEQVARVRLLSCRVVKVQTGYDYVPATVLTAQMSIKYAVAVAMLEGACLPAQFRPDRLADPAVVELAGRVEVVEDPEVEALYPRLFAAKVELILQDGTRLLRRVEQPRGSPDRPLTPAEVAAKFDALAGERLDPDRRRAVAEMVLSLEQLPDVRELTAILRGAGERRRSHERVTQA